MKPIFEYLLNKQTKSKTREITLQSSYDEILKTLDFYKQKELSYPGALNDFIRLNPGEDELWTFDDMRNGKSIKFILDNILYDFNFNHSTTIQKVSYTNLKNDNDGDYWITDKDIIKAILDRLNKSLN